MFPMINMDFVPSWDSDSLLSAELKSAVYYPYSHPSSCLVQFEPSPNNDDLPWLILLYARDILHPIHQD